MIFKGPSRPERWDLTAVPQRGCNISWPSGCKRGTFTRTLWDHRSHWNFFAGSDLSSGIWGQGRFQAFPNTGTWPSTSDQAGIGYGPVLARSLGLHLTKFWGLLEDCLEGVGWHLDRSSIQLCRGGEEGSSRWPERQEHRPGVWRACRAGCSGPEEAVAWGGCGVRPSSPEDVGREWGWADGAGGRGPGRGSGLVGAGGGAGSALPWRSQPWGCL